jgi:hypothetical protein
MTGRSAGSYLAFGLQYLKHGSLLRFVLPKDTQNGLVLWVVLADPLQATLHEALDVVGVEGQAEIEQFGVVAVVIPYRSPALEHLGTQSFPSKASFSLTGIVVMAMDDILDG